MVSTVICGINVYFIQVIRQIVCIIIMSEAEETYSEPFEDSGSEYVPSVTDNEENQ